MSIPAGTLLDQRYRVLSMLGQGGMGAVYLAEHGVLGHAVAIKVVGAEGGGAKSEVAVRRALQEARIAAMLRSPHVVRVSDVFQIQGHGLAIVMERLRGLDLDQIVDAKGLPDEHVAIIWILEACAGLAEAHAAGLVHRDIKLSNIFLAETPEGTSQIKLLDFGIARMASPEGAKMTQTEDVFGSPYFMAPEQVRSATFATAQSDVWSLGVCLYHLLSGRYPFEGDSPSGVLVSIATEEPVQLTAYAPGARAALASVVMKCLVRDLASRFADVLALAQALGDLDPARYEPYVRRVASACLGAESVRTGLSGAHLAVPSDPHIATRTSMPSSPGTLDGLTMPRAGISSPLPSAPSTPASRGAGRALVGTGLLASALVLVAGVWFGLKKAGPDAATSAVEIVQNASIQPMALPAPVAVPVPPAPVVGAPPVLVAPPVATRPEVPAAVGAPPKSVRPSTPRGPTKPAKSVGAEVPSPGKKTAADL